MGDSRDYYVSALSYTPAYNTYSWTTTSSSAVTYYTSADNSYITQDGAPTAITEASSYTWSSSHPNNVTVTQSESDQKQALAEYKTKFDAQTVWTITATATIAKQGNFMMEDATVTGTASATLLSREIADLSVTIDKNSLYIGETATITTTTKHDGKVSYSSANTAIATVSEAGVVTAVGTGGNDSERLLITVSIPQTENYEAATALLAVTVKKRPVTMTLTYDKSTMTYGDALPTLSSCTMTDGVDNQTAVTGTVTYSSSSTGVQVDASTGAITAVTKAGKATITALYAGDATHMAATATYDITVDKATTTLSFEKSQYDAQLDKEFNSPVATLTPSIAGGGVTYSYTSETEGLITLDASTGKVTLCDKEGIATVTATYAGDDRYLPSTASYTLTVYAKATPTLIVTFSKMEFYVDDQGSVYVKTNSANGYTLESSDTEVMTVDSNGGLVAKGAGTAVIRVTSQEDDTYRTYTKDYTVTVKKYPTEVMSFDYPSLIYYTDYEGVIKPEVVVHETLTNTAIPGSGLLSFDATSPTVLSIDPATGEITLLGEGTAAIVVYYEGNYKYEASEKWTWMMVAKAATPGSFIRLRGEETDGGKYLSATKDGDTYTVDTTSVEDASSIIWYGEDGSLLFYECGRYLNADKTLADVVNYGTSGTKFTFTRRYDDYTISAGGKKLLDSEDGEYWTVEDVESLPLQFKSSGNGFSTFYTPQDLRCPSNIRAYYPVSRQVDGTDANKYVITLKQVRHNRIPCETPVVLYTEDVDTLYQLYLIDHTAKQEGVWDGMAGTLPAIKTESVYDGTNYPYTLQPKSSSVGFYPWKSNKHEVIEPFRCYIPGATTASSAGFRFVFDDDETVGIEPVTDGNNKVNDTSTVIYNMQGIAVGTSLDALPAGVYIRGGKKVVVNNH